jgi:hypothetical protein
MGMAALCMGEAPIVERKAEGDCSMSYDHFFSEALARLHAERRYACLPISSALPGVSRMQYGIPRTACAQS